MRKWLAAGTFLLSVHAGASALPEAEDVDRIPPAMLKEGDEELLAPRRIGTVYIELNVEADERRTPSVPIAPAAGNRQVGRGLVDARAEWELAPRWSARASGRMGASVTRDGERRTDEQFDVREAALQWRATERDLVDLGRINLRSGVALGFNPTDYFRARTAVDLGTRDPEVHRNNRLGTVMLAAQHIGDRGAALLALAPRLSAPTGLADGQPARRLRLADTNGEQRLLFRAGLSDPGLLSPEVLAFKDAEGWRFGSNLTHALGQQSTLFLEYSGGRRASLMRQALRNGVALGDLPPSALAFGRPRQHQQWQSDLAFGATWTGSSRLSLSAQFNYHQAGFDANEWSSWLASGAAGGRAAAVAWYLRDYASAMQEPLSQRSALLRAQWDKVGFPDLYLSAFLNRSLDDRSWLLQLALEYRWSPSSRLRGTLLATGGSPYSIYGTDPMRQALLLSFVHYL